MNTFRIVQSTCFVFAAAAALVCGNASFAGDDDPPQRIVKFGDLNLGKPIGVQRLYIRLWSAAKVVCEPAFSVPQTLRSRQRVCAHEAMADAVSRINHPGLTAYHAARTKAMGRETKVASSL
jgi:UrcA family protein